MLTKRAALILIAATVVGVSVAAAAGLTIIVPGNIGSGAEDVLAPPVEVSDVDYVLDWEQKAGFVVDRVDIEFTFTDDFVGRLGFYVELTGEAPLPLGYNEDKNLDVALDDTTNVVASFESANITQEAVEDIHILVCDDLDNRPDGVCAKLPPP